MLPIVNRRQFGLSACVGMTASLIGGIHPLWADDAADDYWPQRKLLVTGKALKIQPVLMYTTFQQRDATSWRSWGEINNPSAAAEEQQRIGRELEALVANSGFPLDVLPLRTVTSAEEAAAVHTQDFDVVLVYPATGSRDLLTACFAQQPARDTVIFARHQNGPTYYWYEALSTRVLQRGTADELAQCSAANHGPVTVHDVVIDDEAELRWRLRALYAVKNFVGHRLLALGGAQGKYDPAAPRVAQDKYHFQIKELAYDDFGRRLQSAQSDTALRARAETWTDRYLAIPRTQLQTQRQFLVEAFLLYRVFKDWMCEHDVTSITINQCMGTIIQMSNTTACLTLSWLNDEGYLAFCESDFVIIPCGVLLHYITGQPVFFHNSTFPHQGKVTCAHCTAPRRLDGQHYEPACIMTHYESDYGAAPKVDMPVGQQVTFLDPEYSTGRWLGFTGAITGNPLYAICRTQQDVDIRGDWRKLVPEVRDSHWMMAYGNHLNPARYATRKIGIQWVDLETS